MKRVSRREFLKFSAMAGAAAVLPLKFALREAWAQYGFNSPNLTKFVDLMRPVTSLPIAASDGTRTWGATTATHYTIEIGQFNDLLHTDFITPTRAILGWVAPPAPAFISATFTGTKLWGFNPVNPTGTPTPKHLGGIIVAGRNQPVQITFRNNLPVNHIIPVDITIPGANPGHNRTAVHIHGGLVPWVSDGGPHDWWAPDGTHGLSFLNNQVLRPGQTVPGNEAEYYYPNNQTARLLWYHDHAWGITRINAYAGIATAYIIDDPAAEAVLVNQGIPAATDLTNTLYLVFQDKIFFGPAGPPVGTGYNANAGPGDLAYPYIYNPALFGPVGIPSFGGAALTPLPVPSVVPEMFGDTILVNGTAYPVLEVEPRRYRIRLLNACNARFLNPKIVATAGLGFPNNAEPAPNIAGPSFIQIGTEGGYLPGAVPVNGARQLRLLVAPAERADVVVDFTGLAGREFILYNNAPGPFPGGAKIFDYFPTNPKTPTSIPGFGPNTRTLLKIRVKNVPVPPQIPLPAVITLPTIDPPLVTQTAGIPTPVPASVVVAGQTFAVNVRQLTLNEGFDEYGRLEQFLGTHVPTNPVLPFFGRKYMDAPTEVVPAGSVEVWEIANLTADAHPIHFHLVNVQILSRQRFSVRTYAGIPNFLGGPVAPDANELGWKETVRMNPGEVTRVIMKFDLPVVPFTVPASPRTGGNEYVWHCHILEHEEHDMMRPLVVV
jgi:spore coat protein A